MFAGIQPLIFSLVLWASPFYSAMICEVASQSDSSNPASTSNYMFSWCLSRINISLPISVTTQAAVFPELFLDIKWNNCRLGRRRKKRLETSIKNKGLSLISGFDYLFPKELTVLWKCMLVWGLYSREVQNNSRWTNTSKWLLQVSC